MMDFKKLCICHYEDRIHSAGIVPFNEAISLCDFIDNPIAYTAFALYCAYAKYKNYVTIPQSAAVALELSNTITELGEVDRYNFVDAIRLLETFNHAAAIIAEYVSTTQAKLPYIVFSSMLCNFSQEWTR